MPGILMAQMMLRQREKSPQEECGIMNRVRKRLESNGIEVSEVSVGSTPGTLASDSYDGITEIRPGNYIFMDRMPLRLKVIELNQIALSVLATVVSKNADYFIIDSGSKTLSSDQGAHGMPGMEGFGLAYPLDHFEDTDYEMIVTRLSEEHGVVIRGDFDLEIGSKVRVRTKPLMRRGKPIRHLHSPKGWTDL